MARSHVSPNPPPLFFSLDPFLPITSSIYLSLNVLTKNTLLMNMKDADEIILM